MHAENSHVETPGPKLTVDDVDNKQKCLKTQPTLMAGAQPGSGLPAGGDRPLLCDHPGEPLLVSGLEAELDLKWHQVPLEENCDKLIVTEFKVE